MVKSPQKGTRRKQELGKLRSGCSPAVPRKHGTNRDVRAGEGHRLLLRILTTGGGRQVAAHRPPTRPSVWLALSSPCGDCLLLPNSSLCCVTPEVLGSRPSEPRFETGSANHWGVRRNRGPRCPRRKPRNRPANRQLRFSHRSRSMGPWRMLPIVR